MKKYALLLLIGVLLLVFVFSSVKIILYYNEANEQEDKYDALAAIVSSVAEQAPSTQTLCLTQATLPPSESEVAQESIPVPTEPKPILPEYAELYARNTDMVGWLSMPIRKSIIPLCSLRTNRIFT